MKKHEQERGIMQEITRIIIRRKLLVFGAGLFGFSLSALATLALSPIYNASTRLSFNAKDSVHVQSQIEWIKSPDIIRSTIEDLELANHHNQLESFSNSPDLYTKIVKNLKIERIDNSHVVKVSYKDHSPYQTAAIVNTITQNYITQHTQTTAPEIDPKKHAFLLLVQKQAQDAQAQLKQHLQTKSQNTKRPLNDQPNRYRLERAYEALLPFLDDDGSLYLNPNAPAINQSEIIRNLRFKQKEKQSKLDQLSQRYGHKHPKIIAVSQDLAELQEKIKLESHAIMTSVHNEYLSAQKMVEIKRAQIKFNEKDAPDTDPELTFLKEQAKETREIFEKMLNNIKAEQISKTVPPAQIIALAPIPTHSIGPHKFRIIFISTLCSVILGIIASLLIEKSRRTFLSGRQLEEFLGLPCSALIPEIKESDTENLSNHVLDAPTSQLAEAVRSLRLTIKMRCESEQRDGQVIALTSSVAGEGKTTLSCWLAKLAAQSGERVILIDADLRRPAVHKRLGKNNQTSLVELLTNTKKLEEVIDKTDPSGLHTVYGRALPAKALDLISSNNMDQLIRTLRKTYDLIIIDTPASMAVADTRALQKYSDHMLYIVSWNKTPRELVHNGISQFTNSKNYSISTVLSNINMKKHVDFGYGETLMQYGDYKEYTPL